MSFQNIFANRLKQLRKEKKLKQEDLGKLIKVTKTQISEIETGKKSTSIENLIIFAEYFGVSLDYLTGRTDDPDIINHNSDLPVTQQEAELLEDFRLLNKHEQNIIIGKISEIIYNKNIENNNVEVSEELINIDSNEKLNK